MTSPSVKCANETMEAYVIRLIREDEREHCAACADKWSRTQFLKLHAGEMAPQELRTATAVARGIASSIRNRGQQETPV